MTEYKIRRFPTSYAVSRVGEGLVACSLPREEWSHEAHLAATAYLVLLRPEIDLDSELRHLISRYNECVGGANSDSEGYHETITRAYLHGVRWFLAGTDIARPVHLVVNDLLASPVGARDWPLRFWSRERLMSRAARLAYVEPDLGPLP